MDWSFHTDMALAFIKSEVSNKRMPAARGISAYERPTFIMHIDGRKRIADGWMNRWLFRQTEIQKTDGQIYAIRHK